MTRNTAEPDRLVTPKISPVGSGDVYGIETLTVMYDFGAAPLQTSVHATTPPPGHSHVRLAFTVRSDGSAFMAFATTWVIPLVSEGKRTAYCAPARAALLKDED